MFIELSELIRQNVGIRYKIKMLFPIPFLHPNYVEAQSIFPGNFMALWKMVDLLIFIQTLIQVALTARGAP